MQTFDSNAREVNLTDFNHCSFVIVLSCSVRRAFDTGSLKKYQLLSRLMLSVMKTEQVFRLILYTAVPCINSIVFGFNRIRILFGISSLLQTLYQTINNINLLSVGQILLKPCDLWKPFGGTLQHHRNDNYTMSRSNRIQTNPDYKALIFQSSLQNVKWHCMRTMSIIVQLLLKCR